MPYPELNGESLVSIYETMDTIRRFEEQSRREADAGAVEATKTQGGTIEELSHARVSSRAGGGTSCEVQSASWCVAKGKARV